MKKISGAVITLSLIVIVLMLSGCSNGGPDDPYVGQFITAKDEEISGTMSITKDGDYYNIRLRFYDLTEISAVGQEENGTLYYSGTDEYGHVIYGNIEEYGEDYPVRVEFRGDGLFDEIEFERK